jgi:hypothetical protein
MNVLGKIGMNGNVRIEAGVIKLSHSNVDVSLAPQFT